MSALDGCGRVVPTPLLCEYGGGSALVASGYSGTARGGIGEGLLGDEAEFAQEFVVGIGFGVLGGKEFVTIEDRIGAGEEA